MDELTSNVLDALGDSFVGTLDNQWWRLCNLYPVLTKSGRIEVFKPWSMQRQMYDNRWHRNVILKVRQIGSSTFWAIYILDAALFGGDPLRAQIIAQTRKDASRILEKCRFAFHRMDPDIKTLLGLALIKGDRGGELMKFSNDSEIMSGITARSGTLDFLLVSEYGKLASRFPEKAREVNTGAMPAVQPDGMIVVESTAEGYDGYLYDLVSEAAEIQESQNRVLTTTDWHLHFYPWHEQAEYVDTNEIEIPDELTVYFEKLRLRGILLNKPQKFWYVRRAGELKADVKREFPSYREEAFSATGNALYLGTAMANAEENGQIGALPFNPDFPCLTAWDLGVVSAVWVYQYLSPTARAYIDYFEADSADFTHWFQVLDRAAKERGYRYAAHVFPWDGENVQGMTNTYRAFAEEVGFTNIETVKSYPHDYQVRLGNIAMGESYFDMERTALGRKRIAEYRRRYDRIAGEFMNDPKKDRASHGAEAWLQSVLFDPSDITMPAPPKEPKGPTGGHRVPRKRKNGFFGAWVGKGKTSAVQTANSMDIIRPAAGGLFKKIFG